MLLIQKIKCYSEKTLRTMSIRLIVFITKLVSELFKTENKAVFLLNNMNNT